MIKTHKNTELVGIKMLKFYGLRESLKNIWRNKAMSFTTIISLAAALVILGIVFVLILNVNEFAQNAQKEFDEIVAYISDEADSLKISQISKEIERVVGVSRLKFVSKDSAMESWKEEWGENGYLLDGLSTNPLQNEFIIVLDDLKYAENVVKIISEIAEITDVAYEEEWVRYIINLTDGIRKFGFFIISILIGITIFIITNTIKINMYSREKEINIMKFIGATSWFIRWPFILEGMIMGLMGGLIATVIVYLAYSQFVIYIRDNTLMFFANKLITPGALIDDIFQMFCVIGMGVGAIGAINAVKNHLKV